MVDRLSLGPVQVFDNSVVAINDALRQICERFDDLKGLRGRSQVWDRVRVDDPTQAQDALTLGSVAGDQTLIRLVFIAPPIQLTATPGVTLAELSTLLRQQISGDQQTLASMRVIVSGWATGTSGSHVVAVTDGGGIELARASWTGTSEGTTVGAWTTVAITTDTLCRLYAAGDAADDSLILTSVVVECQASIAVL